MNETAGGGCRKMGSPVDSHGLGWREEVMKMARNSRPAGTEARKKKEERRFCGIRILKYRKTTQRTRARRASRGVAVCQSWRCSREQDVAAQIIRVYCAKGHFRILSFMT